MTFYWIEVLTIQRHKSKRFAAGFGARVAVAESRYLGGTCANVGCVPKKLLVYGAHFAEDFEQASGFGWSLGEANFDWATLIANKDREINRLNGIYRNLLVNSGVTLLQGHARITGPNEVEVDGQRYQNGNTRTMIFQIPKIISYLSQFMSLQPGDVISTGTPPGVGLGIKPTPVYLRAGQTIRLGITGLGEQNQRTVDAE